MAHSGAPLEGLHGAGGGLDQGAVFEEERGRQLEAVVGEVEGGDADVFGEPSRVEGGGLPGGTQGVLAALTAPADHAGGMVVEEDAVAGGEGRDTRADAFDHAGRLVAEHDGRLASDVPREGVARADAADAHLHEGLAGTDPGDGLLFDADVAEVVDSGNAHGARARGRGRPAGPTHVGSQAALPGPGSGLGGTTANLMPSPRWRSLSKTSLRSRRE